MSPSLASVFAKALRRFQTGEVTYQDFLTQITQHLIAGASPDELLNVLKRREYVEPLPEDVREAVLRVLNNWSHEYRRTPVPPPAPAAAASAEESVASEAPTIILGDADNAAEPAQWPDEESPSVVLAAGAVLGQRFKLVELIGEGGMSRVYKAVDATAANAFIAVKVLLRPFPEHSESFVALQRQIDELSKLLHPNIVRMFGCDRDGTSVFMTMEYLVGQSLYAKYRTGSPVNGPPKGIDRGEALAVIARIADALEFAHARQIIHGDLKPGNVFITDAGEVKLIDFGVATWNARARSASERRKAAQSRGQSAVTPRYASPQLMARQKPEATDDVYALACLAYELLTGSHPFEDAGAQTVGFPPLRVEMTAAQYAAISKGLQLERRDRTPTVKQFMAEFNEQGTGSMWKNPLLWVGVAALAGVVGWFLTRETPVPPKPALDAGTVSMPPTPSVATPGSVLRDCPTCPQLTVLPSGSFMQGSRDDATPASPFERPQHPVDIGYALAMSTNDVTVGEFREFVAATGREMQGCDVYDGKWQHKPGASWLHPGFPQESTHPVTCVSWEDATAYAQWLSDTSGHGYRLPSASEWEYAARAGATVRPWSSTATACEDANVADLSAAKRYPGWEVFACEDGYANTAPVGSFKANAFGLYDMLGNVFQWTEDCWHANYDGAPADGSARVDGDCGERELRGGSWFSAPDHVRASYRNHFATTYRTSSVGFRLVRKLEP